MKIQLRIRNVEYKCRYYLLFKKKNNIYIYKSKFARKIIDREKNQEEVKKRSFLLIHLVKNFAYYFFKSSTTTTSSERRKIERQIGLSKDERATRWKKKKKKNVVVGNVTRNTKVWTSSIGDAYGKIVGAEARVKSRGNRSLWRGRRRVATDVDGRKSTRVAPIFLRRSIDPQKSACIENPTYEPFTNARLFRKDSSWKRYFQGRILFLSQLNVLLRKGRCFINIFSLCFFSGKSGKRKSAFEKFSIIG